MALPIKRPDNEVHIYESTTSIAATPVAATAIVGAKGYIQRVMAGAGGTTTGTITVAVTVTSSSSSDIANGALTIAAGTGARAGTVVELPLQGAGTVSGVFVNEGDVITFTPSGGTGSSIPGAFCVVIRKE